MIAGNGNSTEDKAAKWKDRKEWLMLLTSILIAFIIWLLHSLSMQYSVAIEYNVELSTSLKGRASVSTSEDVLIIRGKADGYYILKQRFGPRGTLRVQIPPERVEHRGGDNFRVICEEIRSNIAEALGGNVELELLDTRSMDFIIPEVTTKKVPIVARTSLSFNDQYMQVGEIELRPDSVEIWGQADLLETIDSVITETISRSGVNRSLQGYCRIIPTRRAEYSQKEIYYSLNVVRYIEESIDLPVVMTGVPDDKEVILLPSQLRLTYRRYFTKARYTAADFSLTVRYEDFINTLGSELVPELTKYPADVISWKISPLYVDCVLFDKDYSNDRQ